MSKIKISLNEVLRDFIYQFHYTYEKYKGEFDLKNNPLLDFDLVKHFNFKSKEELYHFLYSGEASLEIFGHADQLNENLMTHFNMFLVDIKDDEEHEIEIVSREYDKSIPSTLFFLSKLGCKADRIRFVKNYEDKWDNADILITANPIALQNKPQGKISVKVKCDYNLNVKADFEIDSILDIIKDKKLRNQIFNTKITTYENIN